LNLIKFWGINNWTKKNKFDMKPKFSKLTLLAAVLAGVVCVSEAKADLATQKKFVRTELASVKAAEFPAKAAQLVLKAAAKDRNDVAVSVIQCALEVYPAAVPTIVSSISAAVPEVSPAMVATIATKAPAQLAEVVKVATAVAPAYAKEIQTASTSTAASPIFALNSAGSLSTPMPPPNSAPRFGSPFVPAGPVGTNTQTKTEVLTPSNGRVYSRP